MPQSPIDDLLKKLHDLQIELESEIDRILREKRELFKYTLEKGRVKFEQGIQEWQRYQKTNIWSYLRHARLGHILTAPIVYSVLFPFMLLDIVVTLYQHICFRIYKIPIVERSKYVIIDRQHLAYLNLIEKINCVYCGYCNGLIEYVREISARTEQYWCPIKHAQRSPDPHRLVEKFIDYGDVESYKKRLLELRKDIIRTKKEI